MTQKERAFLRSARVAHLATADERGRPSVVPICFALDGDKLYSPIDEKPKKSAPRRLKRVRNIRVNPYVSLVVDRYDEDWRKLAYLLVAGRASLLLKGEEHKKAVGLLRRKYPQYRKMALDRRPIIRIKTIRLKLWEP